MSTSNGLNKASPMAAPVRSRLLFSGVLNFVIDDDPIQFDYLKLALKIGSDFFRVGLRRQQ